LPFLPPSKDKWFCSEICTSALQQNGWFKDVDAHKITPVKFFNLIEKKTAQFLAGFFNY
jgi:hypothetical protein